MSSNGKALVTGGAGFIEAAIGWGPTRDLDAILLDVIEYVEQAPAESGQPAVIETP